MQLSEAVSTIEYKIATEAESFALGNTLKLDISSTWPPFAELSDAIRRKLPNVSVTYDYQPNDMIQLLIVNTHPEKG